MIVDDEPYIRKGLKILINWEQNGYKICGEASNGQEAIKLMEQDEYDLIITDIKMPHMDGMELIEYTKQNLSQKIKFIIISGFYEFEYAKKAIQYGVADYVLKPVKKEDLIKVLTSYRYEHFTEKENIKKIQHSEKIIIDGHISKVFSGTFTDEDFTYVENHLRDTRNVSYVGIEIDSIRDIEGARKEEKLELQNHLYEEVKKVLSDYWYHVYLPSGFVTEYSVGLIYVKAFADDKDMDDKEFIQALYQNLSNRVEYKIKIYVGHMVDHIKMLQETYRTAIIANKFQKYNNYGEIIYYDDVKDEIEKKKYSLDKDKLDNLINAIETNHKDEINRNIDLVSVYFRYLSYEPEMVKMNLDYFLVNLINLASELEPELEREEIENLITQEDYEQIVARGNVEYFKKFTLDFSEYINSLRKNTFGGILTNVINDINQNYKDNLTLKSLSKKYYINSAYLGQIFRKRFACSFKDYLNDYRIDKASELLCRSDDKIYEIAAAVGFNSTDYFISKFVQLKGTTPLQYRKKFIDNIEKNSNK